MVSELTAISNGLGGWRGERKPMREVTVKAFSASSVARRPSGVHEHLHIQL